MPQHTCRRCGHTWEARIRRRPKQCPNCKNQNWDKPYSKRAIMIARRVAKAGAI